ncbi:hypothetical protein HA149_09210 [Prochlorococcus marinus XMU1406]|uniref:hypothetical protein n=1 Tax=Prochlorococcus marinus TaxID=1219 RepID=UPI001ADB3E69|nr:hypothetical protein [Prochlorococcus marinus]MBO8207233.1 hypothetical protein [Prochlorococcus marinus XMU1406]MCR8543048.1 hypothetical protein [Prochlorococcus marinus XMU1427]
MESKKIKYLSIGIVIVFFSSLIAIFDQLLLNYSNRDKRIISETVIPKKLKKYFKDKTYTKHNIGLIINEGSFVRQDLIDHRHHDDTDLDHKITLTNNKSNNSIWIFGDSWGEGLITNEIKNRTLEKTINKKREGKLRIFGHASWSPLLFNLVYRHRRNFYNEKPNIIVFFIDQTDIGDDFCRYRPYTIRSKENELIGVLDENNAGGHADAGVILGNYKAFGEEKSGIAYSLIWIAQKFISQKTSIPGLNSCNYFDIVPYQLGQNSSPNGTNINDYISYFRSNVIDLVNEINNDLENTKIVFITHDWAQHNLKENHSDFMPNNIKNIFASIVKENDLNIHHYHLDFNTFYRNSTLKKTFQYPKDKFSHLNDYSTLGKFIGNKINSFN